FYTGMASKFLQVGQQLELVEAWRIRGSCSEVVDENTVAALLELLRQKKSCRFLGNIRIGLVRNAKNRNRVARADHLLYFVHQLLLGSLVYSVRSLGQRRFQSDLPSCVSQDTVVA